MIEGIQTTKQETLRVRSTNDGIHLTGSILWFDSYVRGELSFLSSAASPAKSHVPQVIATEETIKILEALRKRANALVCQYNRPFSIGRLKIELLPSGCILGGASLYVETAKGRFLYAPSLQPNRIPTVRQMQVKRASTLITCAHHPDPTATLPNRKKERERLVQSVKAMVANGQYPVVFCQPIGTAQEITHLFCENNIPLAVTSSIFRVNKIHEAYGVQLGNYAHYSKRTDRQRVVLLPFVDALSQPWRRKLPDGPVLYVEDDITSKRPEPAAFRSITERFYLSNACDGKELREIISLVDPKELFIFGPYARRYAEEFQGICPKVHPLFPDDQPTLF